MRPGRPLPRALAILLALVSSIVALACGSTSVSEVSGPTDVRCQTSLSANPQSIGPDGGNVTVHVSTTRDCSWTSTSEVSWIRLSTGSGQGEATFTASVDGNPQIVSRSGNVAVNGQRISIAQTGRPCSFILAPASTQFDASGGTGRIDVTTPDGCSWRATTTADWIQIASGAATSSGRVEFQVAANNGAERTGTISVGDKQFVVLQSEMVEPPPNCASMVLPLMIDAGSTASVQSVRIVLGPTCAWTATSNAPWLTFNSPASGTGSAMVSVAVAANTGAARSGTLTIAGQQVTVRQTALSCTFALTPTSQSFPTAGGSGRFTVTTQPACTWTASETVPWIALSVASGTGTADVSFTVQANTATTSRSANISVGGQTFAVTQSAAACAFTLNPTSTNVATEGGRGRFTVNTTSSCSWTATAAAPWVSVSNPSGTGSGDVNFEVQANPGFTARSTTIAVDGQTFTISQAGAACTFSLSAPATNVPASGASGQFTVTTQPGCAWTAMAGAPWVTVTAPPNGNGSGSADVSFTVQPNPATAARSTTIVVDGQTFTINQAATACTFSLNPTSANIVAAGGNGQFTVTTQQGCGWSATPAAPWVTVAPPSRNGSGSGDVIYSVQPNSDPTPRSTTIAVDGQVHTINQAAASVPCTFTINPTSANFPQGGGIGGFAVTTQAGCAWTATTTDAWIGLAASSGTGSGTVSYAVQINGTGMPRVGTITAGGQPHSVNQGP